jgi:hypothetical protein
VILTSKELGGEIRLFHHGMKQVCYTLVVGGEGSAREVGSEMNWNETRMPGGGICVKGGSCACGNEFDHDKGEKCVAKFANVEEYFKMRDAEALDWINKNFVMVKEGK